MRYLSMALAAVALVACMSEPRRLGGNESTVVYEVGRGGVRAAEGEAHEYCARYDRAAHLRNVAEYGENRHVFFSCI